MDKIVTILKYLCSTGQALRKNYNYYGSSSSLTSDDDGVDCDDYRLRYKGNLVFHLHFLVAFDPFIQKLIVESSNEDNKGYSSIISFNTYKGFVRLMEKKVYNSIFEEIKKAKYFSIIIDSACVFPFKRSLIFRYVQINGNPVERFLCFLQDIDMKPEDFVNEVFNILKTNDLDIMNCRGLGYNHSSYMSDKYLALQTKIKESCTYAEYVPYSAYSLNLIGECTHDGSTLFDCFILMEDVFKFFTDSQSYHHWRILKERLIQTNEKNLIEIMFDKSWLNCDDACYSLSHYWKEIIYVFYKIANKEYEQYTSQTFNAKNLFVQLNTLEICIIVSVWSDVLQKLNETNNKLQEISIDIRTIVPLYDSLVQYICDLKNKFDHYEAICIEKSGINEYGNQGQKRKSKEDELNHNSKVFETKVFIPIMDSLISELNKRKFAYAEINNKFGFFFNLIEMQSFEIADKATSLQKYYPDDLSVKYFSKECVQFQKILLNVSKKNITILEMYQKLQYLGIQEIFPEVNAAFRMFLCSPATNFSSKKFNDDDDGIYDNDDSHDDDDVSQNSDDEVHVGGDNNDDDEDDVGQNDDNAHVDNDAAHVDANAHVDDDNDNDYGDIRIAHDINRFQYEDKMYMNALEKIKKYQRCRKENGTLHYQPLLYTESDLTNSLNYDDIIQQFSQDLAEKYK